LRTLPPGVVHHACDKIVSNDFEQPTKFAWSKFEWPKASLKGESPDAIRNAGPKGERQEA
jgi:hypothetical protein